MSAKRIGLLSLIVTIGGTSLGATQVVRQASNRDALRSALVSQSPIRLRLTTGEIVVLRGSNVGDGWTTGREFETDSAARYRIDDVAEVWERRGAAGQGFAIGAVLGAIGGAVAGIAMTNWCLDLFGQGCVPASTGQQLAGAVKVGVVGGLALGGIGAMLGKKAGRWKTTYKTGGAEVRPLVTANRVGLSMRF